MNEEYMKEFEKRYKNHEHATNNKLYELAMKLPKDAVVVDCGAHVGDTGIKLAKRLKDNGRSDVRIMEIEPAKDKVDFINFMAGKSDVSDMIKTINAGLWDRDTGGKVIRKEENSGAWRVEECHENEAEFKLRRLDGLVDRMDLLHLDVEGSEEKALKGMRELINKSHPPIVMEVVHNSEAAQEMLQKDGYKKTGKQMTNDYLYLYSNTEKMEGGSSKSSLYIFLIAIVSILIVVAMFSWINKAHPKKERKRGKKLGV